MRLPVTPQLSTKDGISDKNARLTNCLKEVRQTGELAQVRPGLSVATDYAGLGNGLIAFDGRLLVMVDDSIYDDEYVDIFWPLDADEWDAGTAYAYGDVVWYGGDLWVWGGDLSAGNTPGGANWYREGYSTDTYDSTTEYVQGDSVLARGTRYYALRPSAGKSPLTNPSDWSIYNRLYATFDSATAQEVSLSEDKLTATGTGAGQPNGVYGTQPKASGVWEAIFTYNSTASVSPGIILYDSFGTVLTYASTNAGFGVHYPVRLSVNWDTGKAQFFREGTNYAQVNLPTGRSVNFKVADLYPYSMTLNSLNWYTDL